MQKSVSLENRWAPVRASRELRGALVPWEVNGYFEDYEASRTRGGVFDLSSWGTVTVEGPDAEDYLQRMSTAAVKGMGSEAAAHLAFLTGRGNPLAMGWCVRDGARFDLHFPAAQAEVAAEHAEKFHFAENFTTTDRSGEVALLGLWQPEPALLAELGVSPDAPPLCIHRVDCEGIHTECWRDDSRGALFWVRMDRGVSTAFFERLRAHGVALLGYRLFEYYRLLWAVPEAGVEITAKDIVLEAQYDRVVARDKGCYPGQEVVERIFTYGDVNKKLWPVAIETPRGLGATPIAFAGGTIAGAVERPDDPSRAVGLAMLPKASWDSPGPFPGDGGITVTRREAGKPA